MKEGTSVFQNKRFLTKGVQAEIPIELQLFLWNCIDQLPEERDYFQVFVLKEIEGKQHIHHFSEQPEYSKGYTIDLANSVNQKVYVINNTNHSNISWQKNTKSKTQSPTKENW